jgi:hypothetical protein
MPGTPYYERSSSTGSRIAHRACPARWSPLTQALARHSPHMVNDPSTYDLDDDFFMDMVMEVEGKVWRWRATNVWPDVGAPKAPQDT